MGLRTWLTKRTGIPFKEEKPNDFIHREGLYGYFEELAVKMVEFNALLPNEVEVISIGSSHGAYSFYPDYIDKKSFNLCCASQYL